MISYFIDAFSKIENSHESTGHCLPNQSERTLRILLHCFLNFLASPIVWKSVHFRSLWKLLPNLFVWNSIGIHFIHFLCLIGYSSGSSTCYKKLLHCLPSFLFLFHFVFFLWWISIANFVAVDSPLLYSMFNRGPPLWAFRVDNWYSFTNIFKRMIYYWRCSDLPQNLIVRGYWG